MKRFVLIFLITLLTTTTSFSQVISTNDGVLISSEQLKEANLVFIERDQFAKENVLLKDALKACEEDNNILLQIDSLRVEQIDSYVKLNNSYKNDISDLNKQLKKKKRALTAWKVGGVTVGVGLLVWLILK